VSSDEPVSESAGSEPAVPQVSETDSRAVPEPGLDSAGGSAGSVHPPLPAGWVEA
jgi:hypothetical protein